MLKVRGLSKSYRSGDLRLRVLDRIDLDVERGEIVALLGSSGCGKTTLLNLLSAIDTPDDGEVSIDGDAIHGLAEPAKTLFRRHHIGFVFQFFNLIPTLTVGENVALPLELVGQSPGACRARAEELLAAVGLGDHADRYPETLSGGEQQRVAVARALAHRPRLLLADEPTGNLDDRTGQTIIQLLATLAREQRTSMLIVTHSADVAAAADRTLILHDGSLRDPP
jgi:putative ABC transport system ATP-binding protein